MQFVHSFLFDQTDDRIQDLLHSLEANAFTIAETVSFDKRQVVRDSFFLNRGQQTIATMKRCPLGAATRSLAMCAAF